MTDFTCPNIENKIIRSCGKQIMALGKKPGEKLNGRFLVQMSAWQVIDIPLSTISKVASSICAYGEVYSIQRLHAGRWWPSPIVLTKAT